MPYTRGAEVSRAALEIEAEVISLAQKGVSEITLLGQNVNAWHDVDADDIGLGQLLRQLAQVDGIERLRYTTSHPRDMNDALIEAHADLPELMPYLHLPVQAGSDKILKAMNRKHTAEDYIKLVDRIRAARPDIALSSDFIVGFPSETEEDFTATLDLVKQVTYAQAYSFKYSPRPGTPASEEAQIDEDVKSERLARLQDVLNAQQVSFNASQAGETLEVLFERQTGFYLLQIYTPLTLIVFCSWVAFWLIKTEKGGEVPARTALGATSVLSVVNIGFGGKGRPQVIGESVMDLYNNSRIIRTLFY